MSLPLPVLFFPPVIGITLQWLVFFLQDREEPGTRRMGRGLFLTWYFGVLLQVIFVAELMGRLDAREYLDNKIFYVPLWLAALSPALVRRLRDVGAPVWLIAIPPLSFLPVAPSFLMMNFGLYSALASLALLFIPGRKSRGAQAANASAAAASPTTADATAAAAVVPTHVLPGDPFSNVIRIAPAAAGSPAKAPAAEAAAPPPSRQVAPSQETPSASEQPAPAAPPASGAGLITYSQDGEKAGPYEAAIIIHLWDRGYIKANALYWHDQLTEWKPLVDDIELLRSTLPPAAATS